MLVHSRVCAYDEKTIEIPIRMPVDCAVAHHSNRHMGEHSVQHYLEIYRFRLSMVERGVTSPKPEVVTFVRQLVATLSQMHPSSKVRLEMHEGRTRFTAVSTGELIAEHSLPKR
jgi:hypothetical protein